MASLSVILGIIGNVISILMFASPIKTFKQVVKKKSTENYKGLPYITTLLSTSLWTFYGLLKPGGLLIVTVNGAGAALHVAYVIVFLVYAPHITKVKSLKLVGALNVAFLGGVIMVTLLVLQGGVRITLVGLLCAGLTIGMYAAPLAVTRTVIKTKSVKYMPFLLSFFQFFNAGVWSAYSVLVKDFYVGVPNGVGFILGSIQLCVYMIYKNKSSPEEESEAEKAEVEGSAHLVNGSIQMQHFDDDDEEDDDDEIANMKNRSLHKGNSLPKPSITRQYSPNIKKTISLSPHEFDKLSERDVEKGFNEDR